MLRSKLSRIGLATTLVGAAVLGASLYTWTHSPSSFNRIYYTEDQYEWVLADSSNAAAVTTDEIWSLSAVCQRPYFVAAIEQANATLKAYNNSMPDELRVWSNRPTRQNILSPPTPNLDPVERMKQDARELEERNQQSKEQQYASALHLKYMEWFFARSDLERKVAEWERRLSNVADQRITLGEGN